MRFLFIAFILIFVSCKKEKVRLHEDFVFTTGGDVRIKSFKFINDTVFVAENYPDNDFVYYFLLKESEKTKINSFLDSLEFKKFNDEYYQENIVDAGSYQFEIASIAKRIYVYGSYELNEIKKLNEFSDFIINLDESKMRWDLNNKLYYEGYKVYWKLDVDFGNLERFIIPDIPYDTIH